MRSLTQITSDVYRRFCENKAHEYGFERYSCMADEFRKYVPTYSKFLKILNESRFIQDVYMSEEDLAEARERYKHLKRQCWMSVLRYKYINYYDLDDPRRMEDFFDITEGLRFPEIEEMPMEDSMELIELIVYKIDEKFDWIVLPRELDFTAEAVYTDLQELGVYTGDIDD